MPASTVPASIESASTGFEQYLLSKTLPMMEDEDDTSSSSSSSSEDDDSSSSGSDSEGSIFSDDYRPQQRSTSTITKSEPQTSDLNPPSNSRDPLKPPPLTSSASTCSTTSNLVRKKSIEEVC